MPNCKTLLETRETQSFCFTQTQETIDNNKGMASLERGPGLSEWVKQDSDLAGSDLMTHKTLQIGKVSLSQRGFGHIFTPTVKHKERNEVTGCNS